MRTKQKSKQKSKSGKKLSSKRPVKKKPSRKVSTRLSPRMVNVPVSSVSNLKIKTCEEVEIGDIGGFGSTEELESHENRCAQPATQQCATCRRNLCGTHYELLHQDHDVERRYENKESLARALSETSTS